MKRITKYILLFFLSISLLLGNKLDAYAASASLSGPSTVRAGDTITLTLNISDDGKYGMEGTLNYNSSQVTLTSVSCGVSGWKVENSGNALIAYDDQLTSPLSGTKKLITLKFKVNNVGAGTNVNISVSNIVMTDGSAESNLGTASYSTSIAAPLSSNANLSSLSVSEGALKPGFSTGTTTYNLGEVDYSVSKLNISYKTEDAKAKVSINGNSLSVGENTVSVVVKAENGTTKTYKIVVTRKQDPNYVASSNAALSGITLSQGTLSPFFSSDVTEYVVYLPFECAGTEFVVSGVAADAKAQGVTNGTISPLAEGINSTVVVCKAEDGTEKSYNINVVVMPQYTGHVPNIEGTSVKDDTEANTELEPSTEDALADESDKGGIVTGIVIFIILVLIAALVYVLFYLSKRNRLSR